MPLYVNPNDEGAAAVGVTGTGIGWQMINHRGACLSLNDPDVGKSVMHIMS